MYLGSCHYSDNPRLQFSEGQQQPVNTPADLAEARLDGMAPAMLCQALKLTMCPPAPSACFSASVKVMGYSGDGDGDTPEKAIDAAIEAMVLYRSQVYCQRWLNQNAPRYLQELHGESYELQWTS